MKKRLLPLFLLLSLLASCAAARTPSYTLEEVPAYAGEPYVTLEDGRPSFPDSDKTSTPFERYSQLDYFGRCGAAYANVGRETMPTGDREPIGQVKPSGWHTVKYDCVDGKYLYNRCHLIGYQLTAENANELNLVTGTRYMNVEGMLPFENEVADYVKSTGNHVLYRATPIYDGAALVCSGVELEAWSVEDGGEGVSFHVYVYNVQPGVVIDYQTGESALEGEAPPPAETAGGQEAGSYVLNVKSRKFHLPGCSGVSAMREDNRRDYAGPRAALLEMGYEPCGQCRP